MVDEPSAGLHAEDAAYVVRALHSLVEEGASVVVVEHDLDVIRACDWVLDLGPGGGPHGGVLVGVGTPEQIAESETRTGVALRNHTSKKVDRGDARLSLRPPVLPVISVSHAREHNLKDVSCAIPHGQVCVVTGPSGSGKSSLAFDVVFAEGQRRFMETLTPYARQFLPTLPRPDVDSVTGVPPSIALEQRTSRGGANSTVATVTEVAHYLRLLYAKVGELHCPACDTVVAPMSADALFERLARSRDTAKKTVYAPAVRARKGTYLDLFTAASRAGVTTARVDAKIVAIDPPPKLQKTKEHTIDLIVHFGKLASLDRPTFDRALGWGAGALRVAEGPPNARGNGEEQLLSTARACPACGTGVPELDPRWFSFNTKQATAREPASKAAPRRWRRKGRTTPARPATAHGSRRCLEASGCTGRRTLTRPRAPSRAPSPSPGCGASSAPTPRSPRPPTRSSSGVWRSSRRWASGTSRSIGRHRRSRAARCSDCV